MPMKAIKSYQDGLECKPDRIDVEDDGTMRGYLILCDDVEFGQNYASMHEAEHIAERWSRQHPRYRYTIVRVD